MSDPNAFTALLRIAAAGLLVAGTASAADTLTPFTDAAGCTLFSSSDGARRLREIASQGRVQWEGACRNGMIDGPGILRHEGLVEENGRKRRYAFFLTGVARAGMREGTWIRETFNMFVDSQRYWTSLAVLRYSGSIARGSPQMREVRGNGDFSAAFRRFLAEADRELAQRAAAGAPAFAEASAPPPPPLEPAEPPVTATPQPAAAPVVDPVATVASAAQGAPARPQAPADPAPGPVARAEPAPVPAPAPAAPPAAKPPAPVGGNAASPATAPAPAAKGNAGPSAPPASRPAPVDGNASLRSSSTLASVSREEPRPEAGAGAASRFSGSLSLGGGGGLRPSGGVGLRPREPVLSTGPQLVEQIRGCYLDTINGSVANEPVTATRGAPLRVTGWAVHPDEKRIPERAWLRIASTTREGGLTAPITRNVDRPDVGKALGDPAYNPSGFIVAMPTTSLEPGDYIIGIIQQVGEAMLICQSMGRLTLRQ